MSRKASTISIIIPTYNEEAYIGRTLLHLAKYIPDSEVIVVDGNSEDQTYAIVQNSFPEVLLFKSPKKGRALQMNLGASKAGGDILFFLHADSYPPVDAVQQIERVFNSLDVVAASFFIRFNQVGWPYKILSLLSRWNTTFATYGDQGLLIRSRIFKEIGGFRSIPIFEDLEIQGRLRKKGPFVKISRPIITSPRRFKKKGLLRQLCLNTLLIIAWRMGASPFRLSHFYTYHKNKRKK